MADGKQTAKLAADAPRDMEEALRMIATLREANAALEQFAYVASHDMQEPLRAMSSFSDILASEYEARLDDDGKLYLKLIRDAASRMQIMVVDLLDYARVGRELPGSEPFDVEGEYKTVLDNLAAQIDDKARITHSPLPILRGNGGQFARVLQNLIGNSLKYRARGAAVDIAVKAEDKSDHWEFSVADNGIGIAGENLAKIFEPFKRLHARKDYSGTGLGLSVSRKIVENHGGRIWAESRLGIGSIFRFLWPK